MTTTRQIFEENPKLDKLEIVGVSLRVYTGTEYKIYSFNSIKIVKKVKEKLGMII